MVTEVLVLSAGLAVMLVVHLVLLRRTLAPLRRLTAGRWGRSTRVAPGAGSPRSTRARPSWSRWPVRSTTMLDRLEDERRDSARRALVAQEDERLRIAREMHDQIGQTLTALTIQAERGAETDGPVDPRGARADRADRARRASRTCAGSGASCARRRSTTSGSATR